MIINDKNKYKIYESIFTSPSKLENNCNLIFSIYTRQKLKQLNTTFCQKESIFNNINSKVILLHDMIEVVNQNLPRKTQKLKVFNMTLHQKQYKEDRVVKINETLWNHFKFITRTARNKPKTIRDCVSCVYLLSKKLFGKWFTDQKKTVRLQRSKSTNKKQKISCYNYVTDESLLHCFIDMAYWGDKDVNDFHPDIVTKYKIKERIKQDFQAMVLKTVPTAPHVVKDSLTFKIETNDIFQ